MAQYNVIVKDSNDVEICKFMPTAEFESVVDAANQLAYKIAKERHKVVGALESVTRTGVPSEIVGQKDCFVMYFYIKGGKRTISKPSIYVLQLAQKTRTYKVSFTSPDGHKYDESYEAPTPRKALDMCIKKHNKNLIIEFESDANPTDANVIVKIDDGSNTFEKDNANYFKISIREKKRGLDKSVTTKGALPRTGGAIISEAQLVVKDDVKNSVAQIRKQYIDNFQSRWEALELKYVAMGMAEKDVITQVSKELYGGTPAQFNKFKADIKEKGARDYRRAGTEVFDENSKNVMDLIESIGATTKIQPITKQELPTALENNVCLVITTKTKGTVSGFICTKNKGIINETCGPNAYEIAKLLSARDGISALTTVTDRKIESFVNPTNTIPSNSEADYIYVKSADIRIRPHGTGRDAEKVEISSAQYSFILDNVLYCAILTDYTEPHDVGGQLTALLRGVTDDETFNNSSMIERKYVNVVMSSLMMGDSAPQILEDWCKKELLANLKAQVGNLTTKSGVVLTKEIAESYYNSKLSAISNLIKFSFI